MNKQGLLLCAKYSVAPNYFGYCGPDENSSLIDHLKEQIADKDVQTILTEFETLFLNLKFIATENGIQDPFNERVVEAYWVGNPLLENISNKDYSYLLSEKFNLEKKTGPKVFLKIKQKVLSYRLYPHHSFHVFNIFKRTGHDPSFHTIHTMDECRIGWGRVRSVRDKTIDVKTTPLIHKGNKILLGKTAEKKLQLEYKGKKFINNIAVGNWVSYHWGQVCDTLSEHQVKNLTYYTNKAIDYYNA